MKHSLSQAVIMSAIMKPVATVCRESSGSAIKILCSCEIPVGFQSCCFHCLCKWSSGSLFWQRIFLGLRIMLHVGHCSNVHCYTSETDEGCLLCLDNNPCCFSTQEMVRKVNSIPKLSKAFVETSKTFFR